MNLSPTIIPNSQQLNADDLIAGPITVKITSVDSATAEQPVAIRYEGDKGRPYKPSKSMRRVLVTMWGTDGNDYVGKRVTLYRDPLVTFGADQVGGIKISHASDIQDAVNIVLTVKRGSRKPHRVLPLAPEAAVNGPTVDIQSLCDVGDTKCAEGLAALQTWFTGLSTTQKHAVKDRLAAWKEKAAEVKGAA